MLVHVEPGALADAVASAGHEPASEPVPVAALVAGEMEPERVTAEVARVLAGGALLLCGGEGPLPGALHLSARGESFVSGPAVPFVPGAEPLALEEAWPVTGVGYALYRVDEECVALVGPRGEGRVAFVGDPSPPIALVRACLDWLAAG